MVKRYDFDNDGNRLVGPDGIYVLASDYERLEAELATFCRACGASIPHRIGEGRCPECMHHMPPAPPAPCA